MNEEAPKDTEGKIYIPTFIHTIHQQYYPH